MQLESYLQTIHTLGTLPPGWSKLIDTVRTGVEVTNTTLTRVEIKDGVLYIEGYTSDMNKQRVFDLFTNAVRQESARICMMCGNKGIRRKEQYGKPPLCLQHYADYINRK